MLCACGKKEETKAPVIVRYCENGEPIYKEDNKEEIVKCEITETIEPVKISCEDEDFTFNKETKRCENTISIPANKRIGCKDEENYELRNGACHPKSGKGKVQYRINIYSCPESGKLNGSKCDFVDEQKAIVECKEGYEPNTDKAICEKKTYEEYKEREE